MTTSVSDALVERVVARLNSMVHCGCLDPDDEWAQLRHDTVHLIDALTAAIPPEGRVEELEDWPPDELVERCVEATYEQFSKERGTIPDPYAAARICLNIARTALQGENE